MALGLLVAAMGACALPTRIELLQPRLGGRQRSLQLVSEQAYWAPAGQVERLLAEFPLPGAGTGTPTYLLYLRLPAGERAPAVGGSKPAAVHGFLIQTRGENAGLTPLVRGTISLTGTSTAKSAARDLRLDLTCEDETRITGRVLARRDDYQLKYFETDRRPADVQALIKSASATQPGK